MFIPEKLIDKIFDIEVESDDSAFEELTNISENQPGLMAFLGQESFDLLTTEEHDFLAFLALIIWKSYVVSKHEFDEIPVSAFEEQEDLNWEILNQSTAKGFKKRIDVFFVDYSQEDLLAFVEDALTEDEMGIVTNEGREAMFVSLKTMIDVLEHYSKSGQ